MTSNLQQNKSQKLGTLFKVICVLSLCLTGMLVFWQIQIDAAAHKLAAPTEESFARAQNKSPAEIQYEIMSKATVETARTNSRKQALSDLSKHKLGFKTAGLPPLWRAEQKDILHSKYHIEIIVAGGCVIWPNLSAELTAYNDVMLPEIQKRFGKDVLDKVQAEAEALYKKKNTPLATAAPLFPANFQRTKNITATLRQSPK